MQELETEKLNDYIDATLGEFDCTQHLRIAVLEYVTNCDVNGLYAIIDGSISSDDAGDQLQHDIDEITKELEPYLPPVDDNAAVDAWRRAVDLQGSVH